MSEDAAARAHPAGTFESLAAAREIGLHGLLRLVVAMRRVAVVRTPSSKKGHGFSALLVIIKVLREHLNDNSDAALAPF